MSSVTQRIAQYNKQVGQPRGGLVNPKVFKAEELDDGFGVLDGEQENLHSSTVGLAVDYLTRLAGMKPPADEVASAVAEVFRVSLSGAAAISEHPAYASVKADAEEAISWLDVLVQEDGIAVFDINENAVRAACRLSTYDVGKRAGVQFYNPASSLLLPDDATVSHILRMVLRSVRFFIEHGPITSNGFVFTDPQKRLEGDRGGYTDLVTSGDSDFLTPDTLWDFKASKAKPNKDHALQLLMYFFMGKESGLPEFEALTHVGIFNPRLGTAHRLAVAEVPTDVIETVRRDVIGYKG
ncbi:hypothetical protein U746_0335 [Mycolicibacterium mucogenicum 261Sha1.1M5]|nr:hypothetical protein U746_0335 [Mycolicibacterium mucogenicum 261Sha1.1M5]